MVCSDSCKDGLCNTTFSAFNSSLDYHVSVVATNGVGQSGNITSDNIGEFNNKQAGLLDAIYYDFDKSKGRFACQLW